MVASEVNCTITRNYIGGLVMPLNQISLFRTSSLKDTSFTEQKFRELHFLSKTITHQRRSGPRY